MLYGNLEWLMKEDVLILFYLLGAEYHLILNAINFASLQLKIAMPNQVGIHNQMQGNSSPRLNN